MSELANKIESVLIGGDLKSLSSEERVSYYNRVCESVGLNPLTKPFEYITLNGKLTLYAKRDATDQLRKVHSVSIDNVKHDTVDDLIIVTASASIGDRSDTATGAVSLAGLKGEAKANAIMKAETKAKRRVTLSICGLGLLDESELDFEGSSKPTTIKEAVPRESVISEISGGLAMLNKTEEEFLKYCSRIYKKEIKSLEEMGSDELVQASSFVKQLIAKKPEAK